MVSTKSDSSSLKEFIEDSKKLVGKDATDVPQAVKAADWSSIQKFCSALGDINPLYNDVGGGVGTLYNTLIAPPTFIFCARTPDSAAAHEQKAYGIRRFSTGCSAEWSDIIRLGEPIATDLKVTDVRAGSKWGNRDTGEVDSTATYTTLSGGLIAKATGTVTVVPYNLGDDLIDDREIHQYSDKEIKQLEDDLDAIPPHRGKKPLYWSEVNVGDKVPQLVKGPIYYTDISAWKVAEAKLSAAALGTVAHRNVLDKPGRMVVNPATDWPYSDIDQAHGDVLAVKVLGFNMPASKGLLRFGLAGQVITNWMGDLGFLRSLSLQLPNHFLYEDTMWIGGEVTGKSQVTVGAGEYNAVQLKISGHNQLGQTLVEGTAEVYLPEKGFLVGLPIGNPWQ